MDLPAPVLESYRRHFRDVRRTVGPRLHEVLDHFGSLDQKLEHLLARILDWRTRSGEPLLPADRFVAAFWGVRSDAQNGGFHQYFSNSAGDLWPDLLRLLELGADEAGANHFRRVLAAFPKSEPSTDRETRRQQLAKLDRTREGEFLDPFADLNAEYYSTCFYPDEKTLFRALRSLDDLDFIPDLDSSATR